MSRMTFLVMAGCLATVIAATRAFSTPRTPVPAEPPAPAIRSVPVVHSSPSEHSVPTVPPNREPKGADLERQVVGQWAVGDGYSKFGELRMDFAADGSMTLVRIAPHGGENVEEPGRWRMNGPVVEMWSTNVDDQVGWTGTAPMFTGPSKLFLGNFETGTFTPKGLASRELRGEKLNHAFTFSGDLDLPFRCGVFQYSEPEFGRPDLKEPPTDHPLRPYGSGSAEAAASPGT